MTNVADMGWAVIASGDAFGLLFMFFILFTLGYPILCTSHHVKHRFLFAYAFVFACGLTVASVAGATSVVVQLWEAAKSGKSDHVPVGLAVLSLLVMLLAIRHSLVGGLRPDLAKSPVLWRDGTQMAKAPEEELTSDYQLPKNSLTS